MATVIVTLRVSGPNVEDWLANLEAMARASTATPTHIEIKSVEEV